MKVIILNIVTFLFLIFSVNGQTVQVTVANKVSSEGHDGATAFVTNDIKKDGTLFIEANTHVKVETNHTHKRGIGKPGTLSLNFMSTTDVNGNTVLLKGSKVVEGESKRGKALGLGIGLGLGLATPLFACLAIKGEPAIISANTLVNVTVAK